LVIGPQTSEPLTIRHCLRFYVCAVIGPETSELPPLDFVSDFMSAW
jgi:hypothetical protein